MKKIHPSVLCIGLCAGPLLQVACSGDEPDCREAEFACEGDSICEEISEEVFRCKPHNSEFMAGDRSGELPATHEFSVVNRGETMCEAEFEELPATYVSIDGIRISAICGSVTVTLDFEIPAQVGVDADCVAFRHQIGQSAAVDCGAETLEGSAQLVEIAGEPWIDGHGQCDAMKAEFKLPMPRVQLTPPADAADAGEPSDATPDGGVRDAAVIRDAIPLPDRLPPPRPDAAQPPRPDMGVPPTPDVGPPPIVDAGINPVPDVALPLADAAPPAADAVPPPPAPGP